MPFKIPTFDNLENLQPRYLTITQIYDQYPLIRKLTTAPDDNGVGKANIMTLLYCMINDCRLQGYFQKQEVIKKANDLCNNSKVANAFLYLEKMKYIETFITNKLSYGYVNIESIERKQPNRTEERNLEAIARETLSKADKQKLITFLIDNGFHKGVTLTEKQLSQILKIIFDTDRVNTRVVKKWLQTTYFFEYEQVIHFKLLLDQVPDSLFNDLKL